MATVSICMVGGDGPASGGPDYALEPDAAMLLTTSGQAFILDMADRFYAVPPIGADMMRQALRQGEDAVLRDIVARYDVDRAVAQADLRRLLNDLCQRGVVRRRADPPRSPPQAFGAMLIARCARWVPRLTREPVGQARTMLALARFSFLMFGWSATLAAWRCTLTPRPDATPSRPPDMAPDAIDTAVRSAAARSALGASCKERALAAWSLARLAGRRATVVVGVVQHPLGAHAWCETDDSQVLGDDAAICRRYLPVFRYA